MKAIVFTEYGLPIDDPRALFDSELPEPTPGPHDLLVQVRAIAVNPVDTKVRSGKGATPPTQSARLGHGWCSACRGFRRNAVPARR